MGHHHRHHVAQHMAATCTPNTSAGCTLAMFCWIRTAAVAVSASRAAHASGATISSWLRLWASGYASDGNQGRGHGARDLPG